MDRDERKTYRAQLRTSHRIHIRASLHDHDEDFMHWIKAPILDGQLDVDTSRTPESTSNLVLADPDQRFIRNGVYGDNFVCVEYGVDVPALNKRVWHPQIFGPFTISHDQGETTLQIESKDSLLVPPVTWGRFLHGSGSGLGGNALAIWTPRQGTNTRNEIQVLRQMAPIGGGSFRLRFDGRRTDPLDWAVSAAELQAALEGLTPIGAGNVTVTGGPVTSQPFKIEFVGDLAQAAQEQIEVIDSTTTLDGDTRYAANLLRQICRAAGETRFAFGTFRHHRLPKSFKWPKEPESIWEVCQRIVQSVNEHSHIDWRLFYDGSGTLRVENMDHGFRFDERTVLDRIEDDYSLEDFRNTAVVAVNRGNEARPIRPVIATLPKKHPLSPYHLRRNGVRRYIVERVDNPHIRQPRQAEKLARSTLHRHSIENVDVSFDSLPIPIMVPGSRCRLELDGEVLRFHANKYSLSYRAEDSMSVGYTRRVRTRARRPKHVA